MSVRVHPGNPGEEGARRMPRDKIGMAINAPESRSQDQLHIALLI
jgi:hypothetical protein